MEEKPKGMSGICLKSQHWKKKRKTKKKKERVLCSVCQSLSLLKAWSPNEPQAGRDVHSVREAGG